jgi:hypothetical protein
MLGCRLAHMQRALSRKASKLSLDSGAAEISEKPAESKRSKSIGGSKPAAPAEEADSSMDVSGESPAENTPKPKSSKGKKPRKSKASQDGEEKDGKETKESTENGSESPRGSQQNGDGTVVSGRRRRIHRAQSSILWQHVEMLEEAASQQSGRKKADKDSKESNAMDDSADGPGEGDDEEEKDQEVGTDGKKPCRA